MHTIKLDSKVVVVLDHAVLIKNAYNAHNDNKETHIELRPELFDFHAKEKKTENSTTSKAGKKSQKRKSFNSTERASDLKQQQSFIEKVLEQLRVDHLLPTKNLNRLSLPPVWETVYQVPQLHGSNATSHLQTVAFEHNYLIPPRCTFFNYDVTALSQLQPQLPSCFDLIVLDPPWRNKYIRRLKRARQELSYHMLDNAALCKLPIADLIHKQTIVAIWCTNSSQHQVALCKDFLPAWNLRLLHAVKWLKLNTDGEMIGPLNADCQKQPYEMLYLACHKDSSQDFCAAIKDCEMLLSIPSVIHSHKPPLSSWLKEFLPVEPKCLELFARYLLPGYTSIGLEVLKLMDKQLYQTINNDS